MLQLSLPRNILPRGVVSLSFSFDYVVLVVVLVAVAVVVVVVVVVFAVEAIDVTRYHPQMLWLSLQRMPPYLPSFSFLPCFQELVVSNTTVY